MKTTIKKNKTTIELDNTEAAIIFMILGYMKPQYYNDLDNAPDNGLISKSYIKEVYEELQESVTKLS